MTSKRVASLSLDLDNEWSYLKTHGDDRWEGFPSYLDAVVPRILAFCEARDLTLTVFVVGQDAALEKNAVPLAALGASRHEVGNHSFHHEPWLHLRSRGEIESELRSAGEAIEGATGQRPRGFRGPGFSLSADTLAALAELGYRYDASTLPTFIGPLARLFYLRGSRLETDDLEKRDRLFGRFSDGFRPLKPYAWRLDQGTTLTEIPVSTMPLFRLPIHITYLFYLARISDALSHAYLAWSLGLCRLTGVEPSLLLHSLDFLGGDDVTSLAFFPGMDMPGARKLRLLGKYVDALAAHHRIVPLREHASLVENRPIKARDSGSLA